MSTINAGNSEYYDILNCILEDPVGSRYHVKVDNVHSVNTLTKKFNKIVEEMRLPIAVIDLPNGLEILLIHMKKPTKKSKILEIVKEVVVV